MAEFIGGDEKVVRIGEKVFEIDPKISMTVGVAVMFHENGVYKVVVSNKSTIVEKVKNFTNDDVVERREE